MTAMTMTQHLSTTAALTPIERAIVAALVSTIVKELRADDRSVPWPAACA